MSDTKDHATRVVTDLEAVQTERGRWVSWFQGPPGTWPARAATGSGAGPVSRRHWRSGRQPWPLSWPRPRGLDSDGRRPGRALDECRLVELAPRYLSAAEMTQRSGRRMGTRRPVARTAYRARPNAVDSKENDVYLLQIK